MLRNDGIGGTPRLARYVSIGTPPTPGRPALPKRTPGETDPDQDSRFQLAEPRGVAPGRSAELSRAIHDANSTARTHLPNRSTGECHRCGGIPGPCRPFLRAIAVLDRWEPANARRIRAVLQLSGLTPAGYPHDDRDD
ncbi:hypothetical protein [Micromonospora sp. LOL_023]|uniref:hypothetical protein n=1 Tax=Micromonospora sp. LOL_023 TaxID=3345418 RepID=UPI003A89E7D4